MAASIGAGAMAAAAAPADGRWVVLDRKLESEFGGDRPGCFALASLGGETQFARGYGMADLEHKVQISGQTLFRIASLTKSVTAVAVLSLIDDGRIEIDDAVSAHIDDLPAIWRMMTVRQLLSHTSGISGDLTTLFSHARDDLTPRQLINLYADMPLIAAPGGAWTYSNANYWLLGMLIEKLCGKTYADYLKTRIFDRAGLDATRYGDWAPIIAHRAKGYSRGENGEVVNAQYFSRTLGYSAGGVLSTPGDMAKWCGALGAGIIIAPALIRLMVTPVTLSSGAQTTYSLGWYVDGEDPGFRLHHGGTSPGFVSYLIWRPSTGAVAALFSNNGAIREPMAITEMMFSLIEQS